MKIYVLSILLCVICLFDPHSAAQELVQVSTLDNPGSIRAITPDGQYLIAQEWDKTPSIYRLFRVADGTLIAEVTGIIGFIENGHYAHIANHETHIDTLLDLTNEQIIVELPSASFYPVQNLIYQAISPEHEAYQIRELSTLDVLLTLDNFGVISPDGRFVGVFEEMTLYDERESVIEIIEIRSGLTVAQFQVPELPETGCIGCSPLMRFSPDGTMLMLLFPYQNYAQVVDTATWELLYEVPGELVFFSPNDQYITVNDVWEGGKGRLINRHTGEILIDFTGEIRFSPDGRFMTVEKYEQVRPDPVITHKRLIDTTNGETIFEYHGAFTLSLDENLLFIREGSWLLNDTETTTVYQFEPRQLLYKIEVASTIFYSPNYHYAVVPNSEIIENATGEVILSGLEAAKAKSEYYQNDSYTVVNTYQLLEMNTGKVVLSGLEDSGEFAGNLFFISNGTHIDVYLLE